MYDGHFASSRCTACVFGGCTALAKIEISNVEKRMAKFVPVRLAPLLRRQRLVDVDDSGANEAVAHFVLAEVAHPAAVELCSIVLVDFHHIADYLLRRENDLDCVVEAEANASGKALRLCHVDLLSLQREGDEDIAWDTVGAQIEVSSRPVKAQVAIQCAAHVAADAVSVLSREKLHGMT